MLFTYLMYFVSVFPLASSDHIEIINLDTVILTKTPCAAKFATAFYLNSKCNKSKKRLKISGNWKVQLI